MQHERGLDQLNREIAETEARLRELHAERAAIGRARNAAIVAEFDAGKSCRDISKARGMPYAMVLGICWRAGRTESGRTAIRERLREKTGRAGEASP